MLAGAAGAVPPPSPLPTGALAEQEASGEHVNINWKGLGQKESRFPGAHGQRHKTERSHTVRHSPRRKKSLIKRLWCMTLPASALVCFCFLVCLFSFCVWRKIGAPVCLRMSSCLPEQPLGVPPLSSLLTQAPGFQAGAPQVLRGRPPLTALPRNAPAPASQGFTIHFLSLAQLSG